MVEIIGGQHVNSQSKVTPDESAKKPECSINLIDLIVVTGFALFSFLYFLGRWKGAYPYVFLGGDAANIASFAAAWDHLDLFKGDEVLGNPENFRFYATVHIPILRMLAPITGDYGSAFVFLLGPHIFIQALGFYVLGRVVFHNRYWAALLAVMTLMPFYINLGDYWGIYFDAQPRFTFQVLLPYLLAAFFHWREKPQAWGWLMAIAGSLIYVHPVSAPGWGFALWLGLWLFLPASFSRQQRWRKMALVAVAFFMGALPWVAYYVSHHAHGSAANYQEIYAIMEKRFGVGYLDIPLATKEFFIMLGETRSSRCVIGATALGVVWLLYNNRRYPNRLDYRPVLLIGLWFMGLTSASILVPYIEQEIERAYQILPVQVDLIRGIRYFIPLLLLFCLWVLSEISLDPRPIVKKTAFVAGALLCVVWVRDARSFLDWGKAGLICWKEGHFTCVTQDWQEHSADIEAIRHFTPLHARILPAGKAQRAALSVRYYALRPVVYAKKDGGALAYANHAALLKWHVNWQKMEAIDNEKDITLKVEKIERLAKSTDADYCLIDSDLSLNAAWSRRAGKAVYVGPAFTIWKMN